MPRMSVATIKNPEFINLQPLEVNPLMSACEIKVMYIGQNRNHSFITKEVATEMSKTLRGAPIVGWYREDKGDFADHGDRITIDNDGIKFEKMTRPYGFVAPDAKVWFQEFEDTDDFGNKVIKEYLMTTGYIWDGQYPEAKCVTEQGKPHSMELDDDTLDGKWSTDVKSGMEFFIVNDAIFSKLCILGDDVEPCFEGSSVTAPEVSKSFTMVDNDFKQSLYTMMQQLKFALEGGQSMAVQKIDGENKNTDFSAIQDNAEQTTVIENQNFTKDSSEDKKDEKKDNYTRDEDKKDEDKQKDFVKEEKDDEKKDDKSAEDKEDKSDDGKDDKKKDDKYALLEQKFALLEQKYTALEGEYQNLVSFKNNAENEKKDELIKSFYMLSDEDKKDVIENKSKYSLDDIESKLSVICVRKKVNFDLDDNSKSDNTVEDKPVTTFNLDGAGESVPAWITALRNTQNSRNI